MSDAGERREPRYAGEPRERSAQRNGRERHDAGGRRDAGERQTPRELPASFAQVMGKAWRDNLLFSVLVELTYRCNLDCSFCYNDLALRGVPLSTDQYFQFFSDLRDMQVLNLTLSGGEPLAHPDFIRLGARARSLGFAVRIKSNGHALRGEMARRIRDEIDPFLVEVSLHGATAATHDRQTRVPGSFERLLANLGEMRRLGLRVKLNSTLTAWNEHEVEAILDLAAELGLPLQVDPEVTPRDDGDRSPLALTASRDGLLRLFAALAAREAAAAPPNSKTPGTPEISETPQTPLTPLTAQTPLTPQTPLSTAPARPAVAISRGADDGSQPAPAQKHCGAGSSGIAVDPYGNVYPCVQWRRPVGNLHQQPIGDIWRRSRGLAEVRELTVAAKGVVEGYDAGGVFLNFCPGNAESLTGDPLRIYPAAERRQELTQEWLRAASPAAPRSPFNILPS
jgi:MoaA/NifB/PqqE/SkfB family radical SAM enzyme